MDTNIRICGEAGQGVQTIGDLLTHTFAEMGLHVFATQSYMSRIRGGVNSFDIRIADRKLFSHREKADLIVALTEDALDVHRNGLSNGGMIIFAGDTAGDDVVAIDMIKAAKDAGGTPLMVNSVAAGVVVSVLGYELDILTGLLQKQFGKKGKDVTDANTACARMGAELVADLKGKIPAPDSGDATSAVFSGSEAIGLAAAVAGVKVVSSYPMTPSTNVFTYLASVADKYGIVVEQAEDEICAVNLICGATYAGVPAMTTTSGGGFALMVEGLSLAGMLELPIVIILGQRPGPATGLPTRTAQGDLKFAIHAGHGEFQRAIFAPGTLPQAYDLTRHALVTAHKYQTPSVVMVDQYITDLQKNISDLPDAPDPIDRFIVDNPPQGYVRYAITESGVSPRAIPGGGVFVVVDSDEHTADGHITEDLAARVALQEKRMRKGNGLTVDALPPEIYPDLTEEILLCWGSTYGACRETVDILLAQDRTICMVHFSQVFPLDAEKLKKIFRGRIVTAVEGNCTAQFASMLRQVGALNEYDTILRYDGLPFSGEEIAEKVSGNERNI
ncbi:MAG: 2-oxoacid:acceptor oxidoreductase subunit alpha [bacterium]